MDSIRQCAWCELPLQEDNLDVYCTPECYQNHLDEALVEDEITDQYEMIHDTWH